MNHFVNADVLQLFPRVIRKGRTVVDEKCACGHLRSVHYGASIVAGHGACDRCECEKFTWSSRVFASKKRRGAA